MSAAASEAAAYGVGVTQPQPPHGVSGVHLAYTQEGTAVFKQTAPPPPPMYETPAPVRGNGEHKRKRGRPRKYAATTDLPLAVIPPSPPTSEPGAVQSPALPPGFPAGLAACQPAPPASERVLPHKKRGRPPGSGNKLQPRRRQNKTMMMSPASGGIGLKPNVITVQVGEDVVSKVMSFSQNGWAVCVLSANGAVSNVTLRQAGSSGATINYEGHFEILSLSGSYLLSESNGLSSRTGGLSVSLAGPDGRVLGGGVAGPLDAASPVQVVIGSFLADVKKGSNLAVKGGAPFPRVSTPSSRGTPSGSSGAAGSPQNQSASGSFNTSNQPALADFPWR
uniref:AT-hook motif nuclear-localized protein n=1 Tax=Leersia perrieri TaxID=77586 RepID=A0A0D9WPV3_9ORYZ